MSSVRQPLHRVAVALMATAALLGIAAGPASAARTVHRPASFRFEATLPERDGYTAYLRAYGHHKIQLDLGTKADREPYVTMEYTTMGHADAHGIEADFGRFGSIDLRFAHPPRRVVYPLPNCRPDGPDLALEGRMIGRSDFESIGGVVRLDSPRLEARGRARSKPKRTCTPRPSAQESSEGISSRLALARPGFKEVEKGPGFVAELLARAHLERRTIDLAATQLDDGSGGDSQLVDVAATSTRRFGRIIASTTVHALSGEEGADLTIAREGVRPTGATLAAAPPFSGSATFAKEPGSPGTWLGDLAVKVPGEGVMPLAGPAFKAVICKYAGRVPQRACERQVAPPHEV